MLFVTESRYCKYHVVQLLLSQKYFHLFLINIYFKIVMRIYSTHPNKLNTGTKKQCFTVFGCSAKKTRFLRYSLRVNFFVVSWYRSLLDTATYLLYYPHSFYYNYDGKWNFCQSKVFKVYWVKGHRWKIFLHLLELHS